MKEDRVVASSCETHIQLVQELNRSRDGGRSRECKDTYDLGYNLDGPI